MKHLLPLTLALSTAAAACSGGDDRAEDTMPAGSAAAPPGASAPPPSAPGTNAEGVVFPASYAEGELYTTVTRGNTFEELFTSREAIAAVKEGQPIPSGTVITLLIHTEGRLSRIFVREKRTGWADGNPPERRNGDWLNQEFGPDGTVPENANVDSCYSCHGGQERDDFSFTLAQMRSYDLAAGARERGE